MSMPTINASKQLTPLMAGYRIDLVIDIVLAPPRSLPGRHADVHYHTKDAKADGRYPVAPPVQGTVALAWLSSRTFECHHQPASPTAMQVRCLLAILLAAVTLVAGDPG